MCWVFREILLTFGRELFDMCHMCISYSIDDRRVVRALNRIE